MWVDAVEKGFDSIIVSLDVPLMVGATGVLRRRGERHHRRLGNERGRSLPWRPENSKRERLEVLDDGGEVELVARTGKPPKPHAFEAMVGLQMREPHLNALSLVSRSGKCLCLHLSPSDIAGVLVQVAWDLARVGIRAALCSDRAYIAVALRGAVEQRAAVMHGATGLEQLAVRADVDTALPVPAEVRA